MNSFQKIRVSLTAGLLLIALLLSLTLGACTVPPTPSGESGDGTTAETTPTEPVRGLEYSLLPNGTYEVRAKKGAVDTSFTIPSTYKNTYVTRIADRAFYGCSELKSVTIPESVISIGDWAFAGCTSLRVIALPASISELGTDLFQGCTSLSSLSIGAENQIYHSVDNCLIETETKTLLAGCKNSVIPSDGSVEIIGEGAFSEHGTLASITIPETVKTIEAYAFLNCTSLSSVTLPSSLTRIKGEAFRGCAALTALHIPKGLTSISNYAFSECSSLASITVDAENPTYHSKNHCLIDTARRDLLLGCKASTIPEDGSVQSIHAWAFAYCEGLTAITIPSTVKSIGVSAFYACRSLSEIAIPEGVTVIGDRTFYDCRALSRITLPTTLASIGDWAFYGLPDSLEILYAGTDAQWNAIAIGSYNDPIKK